MLRQRKLQTRNDIQKRIAETTLVASKSKKIQKSQKHNTERKTLVPSSENMLISSTRNLKSRVQQYFKLDFKPAFRVCTTATASFKVKSTQIKKYLNPISDMDLCY